MQLLRHSGNPILKPIKSHSWERKAVFNASVVYFQNKFHMIYRAIGEYKDYISSLGYAYSLDGINFIRDKKPILSPTKKYERWGMEDPRINPVGDKFYITYVVLSESAIRRSGGLSKTALVSTSDFSKFKRHGIISPAGTNDKNVIILPEKIKNYFVILHRPRWFKQNIFKKNNDLYYDNGVRVIKWPLKEVPLRFPSIPSIWISFSEDLRHWFCHKILFEGKEAWEVNQIGLGPAPIKTEYGWLLFYHGVSGKRLPCVYGIASGIYSVGAVLLDLKNPSKVIAKTSKPLLTPRKDYEVCGDVPYVIYPSGAVVYGRKIFLYYGAADKTVCLATIDFKKLLNYLVKQK